MKRLFVILAACFTMVSCQFYYETFADPEECVDWYMEQVFEATLEEDEAKAEELMNDMYEWYEGLDAADQAVVELCLSEYGLLDDEWFLEELFEELEEEYDEEYDEYYW